MQRPYLSRLWITLASLSLAMPSMAPAQAAQRPAGTLVKASTPSVYYLSQDRKRYAFPNDKTYHSWFATFDNVIEIADSELAGIPFGGMITSRPGSRMVKITTDPKVYAVAPGGTLRWVQTEAIASDLYGAEWNTSIDDVPDAFFSLYEAGDPISNAAAYSPSQTRTQVPDPDADLAFKKTKPSAGSPTATSTVSYTSNPTVDTKQNMPTDQTVVDETNAPTVSQPTLTIPTPQPQSAHSVAITLTPTADVVGSRPAMVSFGLPLPPGTATNTGFVTLRDANGKDIPAFVRSLGPWRSMPPSELLCDGIHAKAAPGIRSLLIQFPYIFQTSQPIQVTVSFTGVRPRSIDAETPVRNTWRRALEGSFSMSDGVYEPAVYATIPPTWLSCSMLAPLTAPAGRDAEVLLSDEGQINFLPTILNAFNPTPASEFLVNYKTDPEPWLYDRAQALYSGYIRTGRLDFLREATRAAVFYESRLYNSGECPDTVSDEWCRGFFKLKNPAELNEKDASYSNSESLASLYWLTGDPEAAKHLPDVMSAQTTMTPLNRAISDYYDFTERDWANALNAAVTTYEVTGDPDAAALISSGVDQLKDMQDNPLEGHVSNGCFNHYAEGADQISFSPWGSAFLGEALLRAHVVLRDPRIPDMIGKLAACVADRALYRPEDPPNVVPRYLASSYGEKISLDGDPWSDVEHAADVSSLLAIGEILTSNESMKPTLHASVLDLLRGHEYNLDSNYRPDNWPQNGAPLFTLDPPRMYSWWYKNIGAVGWDVGGAPQLIQ